MPDKGGSKLSFLGRVCLCPSKGFPPPRFPPPPSMASSEKQPQEIITVALPISDMLPRLSRKSAFKKLGFNYVNLEGNADNFGRECFFWGWGLKP